MKNLIIRILKIQNIKVFICIFAVAILFVIIEKNIIYFNQRFVKYKYLEPNKTKDFIIYSPIASSPLTPEIKAVFKQAFYDKNVIFHDNDIFYNKKLQTHHQNIINPHLLIIPYWCKKHKWCDIQTKDAPYIILSEETKPLSPKDYIKTKPLPILEIHSSILEQKEPDTLYIPFISWNGLKPEKKYKNTNRHKFIAYTYSHCIPLRDNLFKLIQKKAKNADALGSCPNTQQWKNTKEWSHRWYSLPKIYSQYNFVFAMENTKTTGYVTEKIITAFTGGAIPIYWGDSKTIETWFNKKAYIDVSDFNTLEEAANYIVELNKDPQKIREIQKQPIFKNNKIPDILLLDKPNNPFTKKAASIIRKKYNDAIKQNQKKLIKQEWIY